jgi:hypothetical protein
VRITDNLKFMSSGSVASGKEKEASNMGHYLFECIVNHWKTSQIHGLLEPWERGFCVA